jgi:hypothetical protein
MAESTERRFTRLLILLAVPNSSDNILDTREIWSFGGMTREIMLVPFLRVCGWRENGRRSETVDTIEERYLILTLSPYQVV